MEKLQMCRICLAKNVRRMFKVVNKNLHELYEKLTDIPFVTEDKRPILACFFCCAKLKQCFRFMRKCLEAEELFARMMNDDFEPNPFIYPDHLEFFGGFVKSPVVLTSTDDGVQSGSIVIKEKVPAVCERQDDIEPNDKNQSDDLEPENVGNSCLNVEDVPPQHSDPDPDGDVPFMEVTIKVEEVPEASEGNQRAVETNNLEPENVDNSCCVAVEDIPLPHSDSEGDVPLIKFKTGVEEPIKVSKKKRRAVETKSVRVTRRTKLEDIITADQQNAPSNLKVFRTTRSRTSKPDTIFKEPYKCDQPSLNGVKKLKEHSRTRIYENPSKCDVCQRIFSDKNKLAIHVRVHTGEKPYKCDVCQRSFSQSSHLKQHIRIHTGEKPYKCDICQRSFSVKSALTEHIRVHTGEKPYKCDVCQRCFSQKVNLTNHVRIHTGEKPYKCDVCQRSFSQKSPLTNHIIIHTGEKPYKCQVCHRSFNGKATLAKHVRIHSGIRPYKCDVCQHSFTQKINLTKHIRIHTGEKPYKCDICQRGFSQKIHLTKHSRIHTCASSTNEVQ